jgi:pimeloyl-ACP methyl ester carboxylesterase
MALRPPAGGEVVVLVHGLWTNRLVLLPLARRLRHAGFTPALFGYPSRFGTLDGSADRLAAFLQRQRGERLHVVGHSLGGVLALTAVARRPDPRLARVVLLGAPVNGSRAAAQVAARRWGQFYGGAAIGELARACADPVAAGVEVGVVAGSRPLGLGRLVSGFGEPNDGTVLVREACHPQAAGTVVLPVSHTGLLLSPEVAAEVACFLRCGRFGG